jgi:hypothetical protein
VCTIINLLIPTNTFAKEENDFNLYIQNEQEAEELMSKTIYKLGGDYRGYCGQYTHDILVKLNIIEPHSNAYNGKDWYPGYKDDWGCNYLCDGWTYECFDGSSSLENILEKYNGKVYNMVFSMHSGPYGHVFFVNAIINDKVYYSESYYTAAFNKGQKELIVADLEDFVDYYYNSDYYKMSKGGIIHFYQEDYYKPIITFNNDKKVSSNYVYKFAEQDSKPKSTTMYNDLKDTMEMTVQIKEPVTEQNFLTKIKDLFEFISKNQKSYEQKRF